MTNAEEIPRLVAYAFRTANTGAKGPVLLDIPIDVLFTPPQIHRIAYGALSVAPAYAPAPDPASVRQLWDVWKMAKRPVIITGTGARGAGDLLTKLAETTNTPVFYSNKFSTPIAPDHKLRGGGATALAALPGVKKPDFVLLLAARTGFLLGGRGGAVIPNGNRTLAQVDIDGSEIGKSHAVDVGIVADVSLFIEAFLQQSSETSAFQVDDGWVDTCSKLRTSTSQFFSNDSKVQPDGQLHPYHALDALMRALPPDSIISIDGGEAGQWAGMSVEHAKPHVAIVSTGYLGFLGNGWGYSIGAAVQIQAG